jgi:hypothetical protein
VHERGGGVGFVGGGRGREWRRRAVIRFEEGGGGGYGVE